MSITFKCVQCGKQVAAPEEAAGKRGKCPHCGHSTYIPAPLGDDDILPLAPLDEDAERRAAAEEHALSEMLWDARSEEDASAGLGPLEHRDNVAAQDLHHFVVNYCLDMAAGKLDRARSHAEKLRSFGPAGAGAVDDFVSGRAFEPALDMIDASLLKGFLKQLEAEVR